MTSATSSTKTLDKGLIALGISLLSILLLTVASIVYVDYQTSLDQEYLKLAGEQRILSQHIVDRAGQSANTDLAAFRPLAKSKQQFAQNLELLKQGNPATHLPPTSQGPQGSLNEVNALWNTLTSEVQTILDAEASIQALRTSSDKINNILPQLLSLSDEVLSRMIEASAPSKQVYVASQQLLLIPRFSANIDKILFDNLRQEISAVDIALELEKDVVHFGRILDAMQNGNRAMGINKLNDSLIQKKLAELASHYIELNEVIGQLLGQTPTLSKAQMAAHEIQKNGDALLAHSSDLAAAYASLAEQRKISTNTTYILGGISILLFILFSIRMIRLLKNTKPADNPQNQTDQKAIARLLDEISNLADGDLTIHATVGEDITGAIAEAINYTIDQLRRLVSTINETTEQVSSAAQSTQATAMHLAEASDQQAEQIMAVTGAVKQMAVSIDTVSINADRSSEVATTSLEIAKKGALAVQNSIRGMDTIREQIQATSKRIKRLGESSQEIADMVELINDIADQTNILALNAAIQASMAGESGHGFAVVADEVQGLAEKSTGATRQIETLVNTILADTHEAVVSMEESTAHVVAGAKITQDAGEALTEIENVSNLLADLTQSISASAQQQAAAASSISASMNVIQQVTTQNLNGTNKTSASVGYLAELSDELRKSVAGFKLPEQSQ